MHTPTRHFEVNPLLSDTGALRTGLRSAGVTLAWRTLCASHNTADSGVQNSAESTEKPSGHTTVNTSRGDAKAACPVLKLWTSCWSRLDPEVGRRLVSCCDKQKSEYKKIKFPCRSVFIYFFKVKYQVFFFNVFFFYPLPPKEKENINTLFSPYDPVFEHRAWWQLPSQETGCGVLLPAGPTLSLSRAASGNKRSNSWTESCPTTSWDDNSFTTWPSTSSTVRTRFLQDWVITV